MRPANQTLLLRSGPGLLTNNCSFYLGLYWRVKFFKMIKIKNSKNLLSDRKFWSNKRFSLFLHLAFTSDNPWNSYIAFLQASSSILSAHNLFYSYFIDHKEYRKKIKVESKWSVFEWVFFSWLTQQSTVKGDWSLSLHQLTLRYVGTFQEPRNRYFWKN